MVLKDTRQTRLAERQYLLSDQQTEVEKTDKISGTYKRSYLKTAFVKGNQLVHVCVFCGFGVFSDR